MEDRRFCVIVTSAIALLAFIMLMRFLPEFIAWSGWPSCGENNCNFQSWLSATSGWVSGGATLFTIWVISRHHRQNMAMLLERNITLAKRIRRKCSNEKRRLDRIDKHLTQLASTSIILQSSSRELSNMLNKLHDNISEEDVDEFEKIVFVGATYLRSCRRSLKKAQSIIGLKLNAQGQISQTDLTALQSTSRRVRQHLERLETHAKAYLAKWAFDQ